MQEHFEVNFTAQVSYVEDILSFQDLLMDHGVAAINMDLNIVHELREKPLSDLCRVNANIDLPFNKLPGQIIAEAIALSEKMYPFVGKWNIPSPINRNDKFEFDYLTQYYTAILAKVPTPKLRVWMNFSYKDLTVPEIEREVSAINNLGIDNIVFYHSKSAHQDITNLRDIVKKLAWTTGGKFSVYIGKLEYKDAFLLTKLPEIKSIIVKPENYSTLFL